MVGDIYVRIVKFTERSFLLNISDILISMNLIDIHIKKKELIVYANVIKHRIQENPLENYFSPFAKYKNNII